MCMGSQKVFLKEWYLMWSFKDAYNLARQVSRWKQHFWWIWVMEEPGMFWGNERKPMWMVCSDGWLEWLKWDWNRTKDFVKNLLGFLRCIEKRFIIFFFLRFFLMWTFLKCLLNLLQYCFYFMFWFFGHEACGILSPQTRDQTHTPCIGRWSLNHRTAREVPIYSPLGTKTIFLFVVITLASL